MARIVDLPALAGAPNSGAGVAHIVGAGPGDPELLTLKALRLLKEADVVLYDRLVGPEILDFARPEARRLFVGKRKSDHSMPQAEIGALMARLATAGHAVVRLKGGDPFVFGRGGEELDVLRAAGVRATVTPGVTAATAASAATGAALTHRDFSQAVTFITAHAKGDADPDLDWQALAALGHTLVVYMGVTKADAVSRRLIEAGRRAETPAAVVENATRADQRVLKTTLERLGADVREAEIKGPAVLIIGEVAAAAGEESLIARAADAERSAA